MNLSKAVLSLTLQFLSHRPATARPLMSAVSTFIPSSLPPASLTRRFSTAESDAPSESSKSQSKPIESSGNIGAPHKSPWAPENVVTDKSKRNNKSRFRQHVNPLSRKYQMQTEINENWPNDGTFTDPTLPLHIDIGCGKGGFLLTLAQKRLQEEESNLDSPSSTGQEETRNYLGLEIRPSVAQYAKDRVEKWNVQGRVDFIGCNANVDFDRILDKYVRCGGGDIALISIQYPDPHFKKSHQKRRVLTKDLIDTLSKYVKEGREIFIQSDIQDVLDGMRETLREFGDGYFVDVIEDLGEYMEVNPTGVPTEREVSVLKQDLPVYRTVFRRTSVEFKGEIDKST